MKAAKVYLINYQNICGTAYGVNLWENEESRDKLEDYVKKLTVSELSQVVCMDFLADAKNISLTEDEKERIKRAAKSYYDTMSKKERAYTDAGESDIIEIYEDYALARKTYDSLTEGVNEEVSDNEARVMQVMQIYVSTKETADLVSQKLKEGADFAGLASSYNEAKDIEITVARGELPEKVEEVAFQLDNNEISSQIKTEDGYYFIRCVNKFDEDLTDANKKTIVEKREKEAFEDEYETLIAGFSSTFDEKEWKKVRVDLDPAITTDSLFTVFEKYWN